MSKISVVTSVYNEEKNLPELLESVKWADEIIVVDNSSTDKTGEIAKKYTDKIYTRPNLKMLNTNKNFGFEKASGEWILNLDGDERVTPELRSEVLSVTKRKPGITEVIGFYIPRKNIIFGKWIKHGLWWPDYQLRLFKKGKGKFPCQHVHEKIKVTGETTKLKNPLLHYNYRTVSQFIQKLDWIYTENEVENLIKSGRKIHWYEAIRLPVADFLSVFFKREGYKDGLHGLVLSLLQSFYALVVFAKAWEKQKFWEYHPDNFLKEVSQEFKQAGKDYLFWQTKKKQGLLRKFLSKIKSPL